MEHTRTHLKRSNKEADKREKRKEGKRQKTLSRQDEGTSLFVWVRACLPKHILSVSKIRREERRERNTTRGGGKDKKIKKITLRVVRVGKHKREKYTYQNTQLVLLIFSSIIPSIYKNHPSIHFWETRIESKSTTRHGSLATREK